MFYYNLYDDPVCGYKKESRFILAWPTSWTPALGGLCVCESLSEDMSPYCFAHDEWLIIKLCMYVGYHDANNVSNFGVDPVTQLNFKNILNCVCVCPKTCRDMALRMMNG